MAAYGETETTGNPHWTTPIAPLNPLLDEYATHNHPYEYNDYERNNPLGLGLDLVVYEFEGTVQEFGLDSVEVQQRFDFNNTEYSGYIVGKANLWRLGKKLLNK